MNVGSLFHRVVILFLLSGLFCIDANSQCVTNVDFNTWVQEGDPADGDWNVTGGGGQVEQNINGQPTYFVSPDDFINVIIEGSIEVNTTNDDDYVGFVFGYNEPVGNSNDHDYWLFDWKQADQTVGGCTGVGEEGKSLCRVDGNIPNGDIQERFFCHNNGPPFQVVDDQWGPGEGWNDNQVYDFTLVYTSTRAVIMVDGDTIFDHTDCFHPGRFGFYNYSQSEVIYSGFQYQLQSDYQILTDDVCVGDTAEFLFADTSCTNVAATLDSTNWDFGDGNSDTAMNPEHVYNSPGNYDVTLVVTDDQGCKDTVVKSIRVYERPTADLTTDTVCFGSATPFTDLSTPGDTAIMNWGWAFGDGNTELVQNPSHTYGSSGNYSVGLVVEDSLGCRDTAIAPHYQPPELSVDVIDSTNVSCFDSSDGSAAAEANGGTPPYSYSWNTSPVQNDSDATGLPAGTYTVEVIDQEGCVAEDSVTITEPPALQIQDLAVDSATCNGDCDGEALATVIGGTEDTGYSFQWSSGLSGANDSLDQGLCAGNHSLLVEDVNGCTTSTNFAVGEPEPFYVETSFDSAHCGQADGMASVDSVSGNHPSYSYQWGASAGNQTGATAVDVQPGAHDVVISGQEGCDTTVTVTVPNIPGPSLSLDSVGNVSCFGGNDGNAAVQTSGGTPPYSYQWDDPGAQTGPAANGLSAGNYQVLLEDSAGCQDSLTVTVDEPSPIQVDVSNDTTICIGGTASLTASSNGGTPGYTHHWDQGLGSGPVKNVSPGTNTTYNVYAVDANSCTSSTAQVTVQLHPPLTVDALSDDSICPGATTDISAVVSGGSGSGYSYDWSDGSNASSTTVSPPDTTVYTVTVEDNCETPAAQDSVEIVVHDPPEAKFSGENLEGCRPVTATFTNETDPSMADQCLWEFGNGELADGCGQTSTTFTEEGCHDVKLEVTSPEGCVDSVRKTNMVCVRPYPVADFDFDPEEGANVQDPEVRFTNLSTGASDYEWRFSGLDSSSGIHEEYSFPADRAGVYDVCLAAENSYGCRDSTCRQVVVEGEFILYVPNAFTPDGDGVNDEFGPVVQGADESDYKFLIFDRWGEVVFEADHPEERWDASINGSKRGKSDVFVWKLITKNKYTGENIERTGHVTVIR